ncbi:ribosome maturation factor RimP [Roseateles sp. BYS180W]|uniref:Ribosome maturation factor RimP n=1 Tax=Roseateles rivi TaxID=3299028 RepID=A0ABW7FVF0_9BURK
MNWQAVVEKTVTGLGYELVGCERSAGGLLRVFIDKPWVAEPDLSAPVNVEDCERVTRQLQYVLEVEACDYERLEVSTPGLDRPLNHAGDYARFCGFEIEVTLREAFLGRKKYKGVLGAQPSAEGEAAAAPEAGAASAWRLTFNDGKQDQALDFQLDEVRSAKLVPVIDFKRGAADKAAAKNKDKAAKSSKVSKKKSNAKSRQDQELPAKAANDKVDGGLEQ